LLVVAPLSRKMVNLLKTWTFNFLEKLNLNHQTIVIGLSGGPDSVALLHLLNVYQKDFNYTLIAAHLDHQWRANSGQDALFCENLCSELGIKLVTGKGNDFKLEQPYNGSQEELGRNLRRAFLEQVVQNYHAKYIMLAHHLDDQIETFLIRLIRGTSLSGLGCMQEHNEPYLRPLLNFTKDQILNYLTQHNLNYVIDQTNDSPVYLRNRIRKLVPELENIDPRFKNNFASSLTKIQEANSFINKLVLEKLNQININHNLELNLFKSLDFFLQKEILLHWLYAHQVKFAISESLIDEILRFLLSPRGGKHQINPDFAISKKQNLAQIIK